MLPLPNRFFSLARIRGPSDFSYHAAHFAALQRRIR
jgi:hypothetical protein